MTVERIFTKPPGSPLQTEHAAVQVVAGSGITGDRYFGCQDEPGQNITFVEAEAIEAFAREHGRAPDLGMTSRNVVTRGVRLNALVGREFRVGPLRFQGVELCEPCAGLGEQLAGPGLPVAAVVRHWLHRAGLRAVALSSGELAVGARFGTAAAEAAFAVRPLRPDEWPLYREIRLRALQDAPDAFGSTFAAEQARPDALWASRLAAAATSGQDLALVAEDAGAAMGLAWCKLAAAEPGVADVFQMWVAPGARGRGLGAALLDACIAFARASGVQSLRLGVTLAESPAMRLYRSRGFEAVGAPEPLREGSGLMAQTMRLALGAA